ncbi:survival motor neuron interacting protein 1-domain-containing protein [Mortierella sp. GBAus27b]|nr:survival motor neuron interacting protein 1-domain-containing protein [Mortierella sp. GBAus27b]
MGDIVPSSGEEYLRMVRAQARSCPVVVIAPKAQEHLAVKNTSLKYKTDWNSCRPAPEGCRPSAEWKDQFIKEFTEAKASFRRHQQLLKMAAKKSKPPSQASPTTPAAGATTPPSTSGTDKSSSDLSQPSKPSQSIKGATDVVVPWMFDEQGWQKLLYGSVRDKRSRNRDATKDDRSTVSRESARSAESLAVSTPVSGSSAMPETTTTTTSQIPVTDEESAPLAKAHGMIPQPRFLALLNQGHLIQLLKYHLRWMAQDDITDHEGQWLYALFLKLDPLVESDQVSVLRNLAKKCSCIRSHLNSESGSKLATVNMVITIVAQLFGQNDLE